MQQVEPGVALAPACARRGERRKPKAESRKPNFESIETDLFQAKLFRRAAGDFPGRASAAFRWRPELGAARVEGSESASFSEGGGAGPKFDLWSLATALEGAA